MRMFFFFYHRLEVSIVCKVRQQSQQVAKQHF